MDYINFPKTEITSYQKRIAAKKIIYTTRISSEVNKYLIDEIYDSPFGMLKVIDVMHFNSLDKHPFYDELTLKQIKQITKYVDESGIDLIALVKI